MLLNCYFYLKDSNKYSIINNLPELGEWRCYLREHEVSLLIIPIYIQYRNNHPSPLKILAIIVLTKNTALFAPHPDSHPLPPIGCRQLYF